MAFYEWDENKRSQNLAKHGIDFEDAWLILEYDCLTAIGHQGRDGELRYVATGLLTDVYVTVVYATRHEVVRIISMRRASKDERTAYHGTVHDR